MPNYPIVIKSGTVFRFVTVIAQSAKRTRYGHLQYDCKCVCGKLVTVPSHRLRHHYKSCGCKSLELNRKAHTRHGFTNTPELVAYCAAKNRCSTFKQPTYSRYGGRGIEFRFESFEQFLAEVGLRPSNKYSLDRIDNDGHYEPGNVRWATKQEQSDNRRDIKFLTIRGVTKMRKEWFEQSPVQTPAIVKRLNKGMCIDCAILSPSQVGHPIAGVCKHKMTSEEVTNGRFGK